MDLPPFWKYSLFTFYAVVVVFGLTGNCVIVRIVSSERRKSLTDWFIFFLTVSDLITILVTIPTSTLIVTRNANIHPVVCKFHFYVYVVTVLLSACYFLIIGVDRYIKVCHTGRNTGLDSPLVRQPVLFPVIMILFCALICSPRLVYSNSIPPHGSCVYHASSSPDIQSAVSATIQLVTALVICGMYACIIRKMRKVASANWDNVTHPRPSSSCQSGPSHSFSTGNIAMNASSHSTGTSTNTGVEFTRSKRNTNILGSTNVLIVMTSLFLLFTVLPLFVSAIISTTALVQTLAGIITTTWLSKLFYINTCINAFIYYRMNSTFRDRTKEILRYISNACRRMTFI